MVGLSVCLLVSFVSPAKKAEPIEMPFAGRLGQVGRGNHVLDEGLDPPRKRGNFGGRLPH